MARIALLWHLHQPDYRHPDSGRPTMPWTRLHALRGYRDLFLEAVEDPVPATLNVVPVLLEQLLWYANGGDDRHLELTIRRPEDLSPEDVEEMRTTFRGGHPAMARHPAWKALKARTVAEPLDTGDLRDLQVWSTLQWFGATARRDFGQLAALLSRGRGFDEADKAVMLEVQAAVLEAIPAQLRAAARATPFSTSPATHPILPLLLRFGWRDDALAQLRQARARLEEATGVAPRGLWPSEGAVSPEVVALAAAAGFGWLASDRGVLARSDRVPDLAADGPWDLGDGVRGFFRDTELSDRIGFHYATWDPADAVADLERRLEGRDGLVAVILDGENPWESFEDAGGAFRRRLAPVLRRHGVTFDEAATWPPVGAVSRLHTGSWIGANLDIWYGHADDRRAWSEVGALRAALVAAHGAVPREAAGHLAAAQGSDWTWWYGPEFSTEHAVHFDALFRAHLRAGYRAGGLEPPASLEAPLASQLSPITQPARVLAPTLTPDPTWTEWAGAGEIRWQEGAMAHGRRDVKRIRYGWSADGTLWLRADLAPATAGRFEVWIGSTRMREGEPGICRGPDTLVARTSATGPVAVRLVQEGAEVASWPPGPAPLPAVDLRSLWST